MPYLNRESCLQDQLGTGNSNVSKKYQRILLKF